MSRRRLTGNQGSSRKKVHRSNSRHVKSASRPHRAQHCNWLAVISLWRRCHSTNREQNLLLSRRARVHRSFSPIATHHCFRFRYQKTLPFAFLFIIRLNRKSSLAEICRICEWRIKAYDKFIKRFGEFVFVTKSLGNCFHSNGFKIFRYSDRTCKFIHEL